MLTAQLNYSYSHALDEISNGGFNGFSGNSVYPSNPGTLRQNYGNADYDTRNYFSGNYVFNLPFYGGPRLLTDGWQITGDGFHSSGLPFTFTDTFTATSSLANYDYSDASVGASLFAKQTVRNLPNKCSGNGATYGKSCKATFDLAPATDFGQQERNQVFGPSYTDFDVTISKGFSLHKVDEGSTLRLGVQMFNAHNHPNFGQPNHDLSSCYNSNTGAFVGCSGTTVGTITSTVNPPTSILGSFLGGDASPPPYPTESEVQLLTFTSEHVSRRGPAKAGPFSICCECREDRTDDDAGLGALSGMGHLDMHSACIRSRKPV